MENIGNDIIDLSSNEEATTWNSRHEEIFINIMEEEVLKGNRSTLRHFQSPHGDAFMTIFMLKQRGAIAMYN